jgi:glycosyltransferase involved in cell wall biosynthesis
LYVVAADPISPNFRGGGSVIYFEHLAALSELGHPVHLWHYGDSDQREQFDRFVQRDAVVWKDVRKRCASTTITTIPARAGFWDRVTNQIRGRLLGRTPVPRRAAWRQLKEIIAKIQPDVIWAQHFEPALLAAAQLQVPVVYSHHDWLYRIKALRFRRAEDNRQRALEERVAKQVAAVVSGSAIECAELHNLGCRQVHYIPVSYEPVPWDSEVEQSSSPRMVHLGGMGTTASRVGLERFFEIVWPRLEGKRPELVVVGDTAAAPPNLQTHLKAVTCLGFVNDLREVLRPFDLHIIPWEHSTGQRTRVPVAFNFGQVVVAVRGAVACFPEAVDQLNCRLVDRLEEMGDVIRELVNDAPQRERLGRAARSTFNKSFTRRALLPRFAEVVEAVAA